MLFKRISIKRQWAGLSLPPLHRWPPKAGAWDNDRLHGIEEGRLMGSWSVPFPSLLCLVPLPEWVLNGGWDVVAQVWGQMQSWWPVRREPRRTLIQEHLGESRSKPTGPSRGRAWGTRP